MSLTRPIVVGCDGSPGGRDALMLARRLAEALHRPVEVLSVLTYAPVSKTVDEYNVMLHRDEKRLAREAREVLDGLEVETLMIPSSSPARELNDLCEARNATALVIGARRHDWRGEHHFDGLGGRLLTAAPCAVAIAPTSYVLRAPFSRILVAFDGSPEARLALVAATEIARGSHAAIRLITARDPQNPLGVAQASEAWAGLALTEDAAQQSKRRAQRINALAVEELGGATEGVVAVGENPAAAITAECRPNDLLIVGSRGYGPLRRVLLGSTSREVVDRAPCAVMVLPREAGVIGATEPVLAALAADPSDPHWHPVQTPGVEPPVSRAS